MDTDNSRIDSGAVSSHYIRIFIIKAVLGIWLLVCGGLAVRYTEGQDVFGPPYYIGAFVAGGLMVLSCLCAIVVVKKMSAFDVSSATERQEVAHSMLGELAFNMLTLMGCFFGLFFVGIFGLKGCDDPSGFAHGCNYTANISENKKLSIAILVGLLLTTLVGIYTMYMGCCHPLLAPFRVTNRTRYLFSNQGQVAIPVQAHFTAMGNQPQYTHHTMHVNMHDFGTDISVVPENNAELENLKEQNRLLRENLELQAQLAQQQAQFGATPSHGFPAPPPPSYNECVDEPTMVDLGAGEPPRDIKPSAPPM